MMRHFDYDIITLDIHFIQTINVIIICATEINNRLMKQLKTVIPIGASDLVHFDYVESAVGFHVRLQT